MTISEKHPKLRRDGQPKQTGRNPQSRANLQVGSLPGSVRNPKGYSVTAELKHMLATIEPKSGEHPAKAVARTMISTACTPDSRGYSTALTQLLDRTEGKVPGDGVQVNFNTIEVVIIEAPPPPDIVISNEVI